MCVCHNFCSDDSTANPLEALWINNVVNETWNFWVYNMFFKFIQPTIGVSRKEHCFKS